MTLRMLLLSVPDFLFGIPVLLSILVMCVLRRGDARWEKLFAIVALEIPLDRIGVGVANQLSRVRPLKLDLYACSLDSILGQPSFLLGRLLVPYPSIRLMIVTAYNLIPIAVVCVLALYVFYAEEEFVPAVKAVVLNWALAPIFYIALPICGPAFAFPAFPAGPGHFTLHPLLISAPPNGMPSIHTSTAILILWLGRRWLAARIFGVLYLAVIVLATLASGQHYAIDLIAAVPYVALVLWLSRIAGRSSPARLRATTQTASA